MASRKKTLQTNFSAGEIAPELGMRQDTDQYQNGAKSLRNRRCLVGGGTVRRPGSWDEIDLPGPSRIEEFTVNQTTKYVIAFGSGRMNAYVQTIATGHLTAAGSLSGCAWTGTIWNEMDLVQSGNTMFLVHKDMISQVVTRTAAATWAQANFSYFVGPASRPEQPYLKVAAPAMTLRPSALTGSITLTASAALFVAAHVGQYIRYQSKAMLITAVASTLSATATVIEQLPDTQDLTVTSSAKFAVGDVVSGSSTGAKGVVTIITDGTHLSIVITEKLIVFTTADTLTGPNATTAISAAAAAATKAAVLDWDEQLFGPVYGYPACVELHRNRLLFGGHPSAPDYLIGSVINNLYNFNVGTGADTDAIIESVGDAAASTIVQLHSGEQLIVLTDHGPYYVPENKTNPFVPSNLAFYPFGSPWPVTATAKAHAFDGGVLFVSASLIVAARPTGNVNQQWNADDDVGVIANHIISNPARLTVVSNFAGGVERYAVFINDDGTLAVLQLVDTQKIRNITPWDTTGTYSSVCGIGKYLYASTQRSVAGNTRYYLELFDQDLTVDLATQYATEALMATGIPDRYGATAVNVIAGTQHLGLYPPTLTTLPAGPYIVGLNYESVIETLPPVVDDQEGSAAGDYMRILEAYVHVIGSQRFATEGYNLQAYDISDDIGEAPPNKDGPQRFQFLGWEREPTLTITQPDPLPLEILAIKSTVAF